MFSIGYISLELFYSFLAVIFIFTSLDFFSLHVLFSHWIKSCDNTLRNHFFQISSCSRAYVRIIYEKTMGQVPLGSLLWKQNIQAKGRSSRKVMGGGEVQKKYSRKGKLNEKKIMHPN